MDPGGAGKSASTGKGGLCLWDVIRTLRAFMSLCGRLRDSNRPLSLDLQAACPTMATAHASVRTPSHLIQRWSLDACRRRNTAALGSMPYRPPVHLASAATSPMDAKALCREHLCGESPRTSCSRCFHRGRVSSESGRGRPPMPELLRPEPPKLAAAN